VYIDRHLVVDIGGVHGVSTNRIDTSLDLKCSVFVPDVPR